MPVLYILIYFDKTKCEYNFFYDLTEFRKNLILGILEADDNYIDIKVYQVIKKEP